MGVARNNGKKRETTRVVTDNLGNKDQLFRPDKGQSGEKRLNNACLTRSYKKLSNSLENLSQDPRSKNRIYEVQRQAVKVSRPYAKTNECNFKKCPSTPDLTCNTEHIAGHQNIMKKTHEKIIPKESSENDKKDEVVRRRPRKAIPKSRPRSEVREKEVWIDGDKRRPLSYIEGTKEQSSYMQTCRPQVGPSYTRPLLSGLVWQQSSGLFARWKEVFLILTKDCVRSHKISSAKSSQFG